MPRRVRLDAEKPIYHGIMRGIEKRPIFGDDLDREMFSAAFWGEVLENILFNMRMDF